LATATKDSPNISWQLGSEDQTKVKFPKRLRYRGKGKVLATIYKRKNCYRLYWRARVEGKPKSLFKDFAGYSAAKQAGDKVIADLVKNAPAAGLLPGQVSDAGAAFERLRDFFRSTGKRVTLLGAVSEYCELASRVDRPAREVAEGYLNNVASVTRKDISQAVEEFIAAMSSRTKSSNGERPQVSPKYHYNRSIMLRRFAATFRNTAVSELTKEHLNIFIEGLAQIKSRSGKERGVISPKGRNHHRAAIRQFLGWGLRKDYLPITHRLGEADAMRPEHANHAEIEFYSPTEFKALLDSAEGFLQAMIAIGGLAGLRTQELFRLDWADLWRIKGHIEITAVKSKTRQRRLVEICPSLHRWLQRFRNFRTGKVCSLNETIWQKNFAKLCEAAGVERKSNGLRHAFCSYGYVLKGEIWTAQQAGHAPALLHAHYRGLATHAQAKSWFGIKPLRAQNLVSFPEELMRFKGIKQSRD
jgi:integrase